MILFNHGWIEPSDYRTTERYVEYVNYIARSGYILFRSDYRGHGSSEGEAGGVYSTPNYTVDVLNALAAVKTLPEADPDRIGMWGHSMGGYITLRSMVVSDEIKAGVIWGGVVADYPDLFGAHPGAGHGRRRHRCRRRQHHARTDAHRTLARLPALHRRVGRPSRPPSGNRSPPTAIWPTSPARSSSTTPSPTTWCLSPPRSQLQAQMEAAGRPSELYLYEADSHDIDNNFFTAMRRTVEFFDTHVKGTSP